MFEEEFSGVSSSGSICEEADDTTSESEELQDGEDDDFEFENEAFGADADHAMPDAAELLAPMRSKDASSGKHHLQSESKQTAATKANNFDAAREDDDEISDGSLELMSEADNSSSEDGGEEALAGIA